MKNQTTAHSLYALYETLPKEVQQAFLIELLHHKQQELLHLMTVQPANHQQAKIIQGDKNIDPTALFGLWQDSPRNLTTLRTQAWQRSNHGFM